MNWRFIMVIFLFLAVSFVGDLHVSSSDDAATADTLFAAKQFRQAKGLYRQAYINAAAGADASPALFGIARSDYKLKNYYEAAIELKRFFQLYPESALAGEAHLLWGLCLVQIHKYDEAEQQFDMVKGEQDSRATIARAEIALLKNDTDKAEKLLAKLDKKTYDSDYRAIYLRAMILSKNNKHAEAIRLINKIPDDVLKEEGIAVSKAIIYYNARRYIDAKEMLTEIVKHPSSRIEAMQAKRTLFQISDMEHDDDEMLKLALDLMDYEATDDIKLKIVSIYEKRHDMPNVYRYLITIRDKQLLSDTLEARLKKSVAEKDPKADEYLSKYYVYLSPDSPYNLELSGYMASKGKMDIARNILRRMLKGKLGAEAALALSGILISEKNYVDARSVVLPITTDAHYSGQADLLMAQIAEAEGKPSESAEFRNRAIRVLSLQKDYYRVGELYMMAGKRAEALRNYERAAGKGDVIAMVKAADLFYITGKTARARDYYKKAIDKGIKDPKSEQWADYQYGKLANSDEFLDKAIAGGGVVGQAAEIIKWAR